MRAPRKFKITKSAALEIGSLYNTIMSSEILMKGLLEKGPWNAESYDNAANRAQAAARTLATKYGIAVIGYCSREDVEDYRRGALDL